MSKYTQLDIIKLDAEELLECLNKLCTPIDINAIETVEDLQKASKQLGKLGTLYAWLINMETRCVVLKKINKKTNKEQYEEFMLKEQIFNSYAKQVNTYYTTISRMITIKQQINQELKMLNYQI